MKFNFLKKGILFAALGLALGSCTDNGAEDLFDKNATERLEERKLELSNALLASDYGWKATYFTDDTQMGGFTHLFKFSDDLFVDMASDFDAAATTIQRSQYDFQLGSTMSLVFTTPNKIHLLSDNAVFPTTALRGKGYKGDFQFLYYGLSNDGIDFQSNRQHIPIRFEKATADDWSLLATNLAMMTEFGRMKKLYVQETSGVKSYNVTYGAKARFAGILSADKTESVNENAGVGIGFSYNSIVISPSIEVDGVEYTVFNYKSGSETFASEDGKVFFGR